MPAPVRAVVRPPNEPLPPIRRILEHTALSTGFHGTTSGQGEKASRKFDQILFLYLTGLGSQESLMPLARVLAASPFCCREGCERLIAVDAELL